MAKRTAHRTALAPFRPGVSYAKPIVIRVPSGMKKARGHRRGGGKARTEKHRMGAIVGGIALGLMDKSGISLPVLPFLGKAGTAAVILWGVGKFTGSRWADDACTGCAAIAAYELASQGKISGDDSVDGVPDYVAGM